MTIADALYIFLVFVFAACLPAFVVTMGMEWGMKRLAARVSEDPRVQRLVMAAVILGYIALFFLFLQFVNPNL